MTSARFAMFLTRSSPRSDLRLMVMDFLLALNNRKYQESWFGLWLGPDCRPNKERPASPPCGFYTLTTSAPSQASDSVQDGPGSNVVSTRTWTPARKAGNSLFVAIFSSSPQWHRLRQMFDVVDINRCLWTASTAACALSRRRASGCHSVPRWPSALDPAHGEAGGHAAAKRVIDRDRRERIDDSRSHHVVPRCLVAVEKLR